MDSEEAVAAALLASLNVDQYEPEVLGIVLEQMHRTVQVLLSDSRDLSIHCGRDTIAARDVRKVRSSRVLRVARTCCLGQGVKRARVRARRRRNSPPP